MVFDLVMWCGVWLAKRGWLSGDGGWLVFVAVRLCVGGCLDVWDGM